MDRIDTLTRGQTASGIKNVTVSEDFFAHHFPERPIMPGTLMLECLVQLADFVVRDESEFHRTGTLAEVSRLKLRKLVEPGDRLVLKVDVVGRNDGTVAFAGQAQVEGATVIKADFVLQPVPLAPLQDVADARRWFQVITAGIAR